MAFEFRPFSSRMLVKPIPVPEKIGSLFVPESVQKNGLDDTKKAKVVAMGPGMRTKKGNRWPMPDCKPGDTVLLAKLSGFEIKIDGEEFLIVRDDHIIGVVDNE